MDLKELQTFVILADYLHFGAAAQHLGIAQPQVSRRISALEKQLDASLFERSNRRVKLTTFGQAFLPEAIALVKHADATRQRAIELARGRNGVLTVSMIDAATLIAAPRVFRTLHERHPDAYVTFRPNPVTSAGQLLLLTENAADVVFTHPPERLPDNIDYIRLVDDPLVAVLPHKHPLAGRAHLDLAELADDDWIMFLRQNNPPLHDGMIRLCQSAGFTPRVVFETSHMLTRFGLVASGYGVHLVHRAWQRMPYPDIVYIPITPTMNIEVSCFWRKDNQNDLLRKLITIVREYEV